MTQACPVCSERVEKGTHFCRKCGTPLTTFATTDPLQAVRAQGEMVRGAMKKPSRLVVAGIWLLFGPPCVALGFCLFLLLADADPNTGVVEKFIGTVILLFVIALYVAIIRRVTRKFLASKAKQSRTSR
jgi:hypothetical protein